MLLIPRACHYWPIKRDGGGGGGEGGACRFARNLLTVYELWVSTTGEAPASGRCTRFIDWGPRLHLDGCRWGGASLCQFSFAFFCGFWPQLYYATAVTRRRLVESRSRVAQCRSNYRYPLLIPAMWQRICYLVGWEHTWRRWSDPLITGS